MNKREEILEAVNEKLDILSLPESALFVQSLLEDPGTTAKELASVISSDATLTSLLLRQANSPLYGFSKSINTVSLAIVVLGFDAVREIALSVSIVDVAGNIFNPELISSSRFWSHSLATALACRVIARRWQTALPGEAFVAGLLHDLGSLIIASHWPAEYKMIISEIINNKIQLHEAEMKILGTNHAEVAGCLVDRWRLPNNLSSSISSHHNPTFDVHDKLGRSVAVANQIARRGGFFHEEHSVVKELDPSLTEPFVGFQESVVRSEMKALYDQAVSLLDLLQRENLSQ